MKSLVAYQSFALLATTTSAFVVHVPTLHRTPSFSFTISGSIMASNNDNDNYFDNDEDDALFADFDVDAAVAAKLGRSAEKKSVSSPPPAPPPPKRAKVSPEQQQQQQQQQSSSFSKDTTKALYECLDHYFGYKTFHPGQLEAIQAVLKGQDVAIFWATGSGKSLTFLLPPLLTQKVALIVSPLISLMQDQVHKLNSLVHVKNKSGSDTKQPQKFLATYLGSAQSDASMERRALKGEFPIVFLTPEKLLAPGFLDAVARNLDLCLVAIDESHCVSDWGHSFRPEYRQAGISLRSHAKLQNVPLMALTATAVPRIQEDILQTLRMRTNVYQSKKSFDRSNLSIHVHPKKDGSSSSSSAIRAAMEPLIQSLVQEVEQKGLSGVSATIVYAPTKNQVEEICSLLQQRLQAAMTDNKTQVPRVEYYHGDVPLAQRQATHLGFLTGKIAVVVATVAFGMGIDKPDTRKVIHFGPPQTVEDYYQQIGRAGRDGLPSTCILYASRSDFDKYQSDFYVGGLNASARQATLASTQALKEFALQSATCRRKLLLEFFDETPPFGEVCGTCDVCCNRQIHGADATRDFGPQARLILSAIHGLADQGMTTLLQVLAGKVVDRYRYQQREVVVNRFQEELIAKRSALPKELTNDQIKEFVTALVHEKYILEVNKKAEVNGYTRNWTVFQLTQKGIDALTKSTSLPIVLPVPVSIRQAEEQEAARKKRVLEQLEAQGIDLDKLPAKEVEDGEGEVIQAYLTWNRRIEALEKQEKVERLAQLHELSQLLRDWRVEAAERLQIAPASVLPEHIMFAVAYAAQGLPPGMSISPGDLERTGARSSEIQSLADVINNWIERYQRPRNEVTTTTDDDPVLQLPAGKITPPQGKWAFAVYKPQKKTGLASWESSYLRFCDNGESPTTIAMSPATGRPLAVSTVIGHIQEGFLQGRPVDLQRLVSATAARLPTRSQWVQLEQAESEMGMNVAGDPATSGKDGGKFAMTDLLRPIVGNDLCDKPYDERTPADKELLAQWFDAVKWYMLLRRTEVPARFV